MCSKKMSMSRDFVEWYGIWDNVFMYMLYYMFVLVWVREYSWSYFKGDFVVVLMVVGMYVFMVLLLVDNLVYVLFINGLYLFVFNLFIYVFLGSCLVMVIGFEVVGLLFVGMVIKGSVDKGEGGDNDVILYVRICGIVVGLVGVMVLIVGVVRFGFLDSVLLRLFFWGFISVIGVVIVVD